MKFADGEYLKSISVKFNVNTVESVTLISSNGDELTKGAADDN
jgi:hypothetical protein